MELLAARGARDDTPRITEALRPEDDAVRDRPTAGGHLARFALLALWCAAIWFLSAQSDPADTVGFRVPLPDWAEHGIAYAVGGVLALRAARPLVPRFGVACALAFCLAWGALDEWHQSLVPGRNSDRADVAADLLGAGLGCALHELLRRAGPRRSDARRAGAR